MVQTIRRHDQEGESFSLGDRLLYLRTPHFCGDDVEELQRALGALGFACGGASRVFGAYTEGALRKFQLNMGLEPDGIAGVNTYAILRNLHNAWSNKPEIDSSSYMGYARASDVLERNAVCLFGTCSYTRKVASYISNLALATNPSSRLVSADNLLVAPDASMLMVHLVQNEQEEKLTSEHKALPFVSHDTPDTLVRRLAGAINTARSTGNQDMPARLCVEVGSSSTEDTQCDDRRAHHDAITILDALCVALALADADNA